MGYRDRNLAREGQPHWYVVWCDGAELGSSAETDDACGIARKHAGVTLLWKRCPALWWAVGGGCLYEIRKLREPREVTLDVPPRRRHG